MFNWSYIKMLRYYYHYIMPACRPACLPAWMNLISELFGTYISCRLHLHSDQFKKDVRDLILRYIISTFFGLDNTFLSRGKFIWHWVKLIESKFLLIFFNFFRKHLTYPEEECHKIKCYFQSVQNCGGKSKFSVEILNIFGTTEERTKVFISKYLVFYWNS